MSAQIPIVNAGLEYVNGLNLVYVATPPSPFVTGKVFVMGAGACRDSSNQNDIVMDQQLDVDGHPIFFDDLKLGAIINGLQVGANGVDLAPLEALKLYAVYVIGDSTKYKPTAGLLSLRYPFGTIVVDGVVQEVPILPVGYDMFRRVGWVRTTATAFLEPWFQYGVGQERMYYWENSVHVATGFTGGPTDIPIFIGIGTDLNSPTMPPINTQVLLSASMSAPGNLAVSAYGSVTTNLIVYQVFPVALKREMMTVPERLDFSNPIAPVPTISAFAAGGNAEIFVSGFEDIL
jgi:hypothetical protein